MNINEILENRHKTLLEWESGWESCGPEGNELSANVVHRATVHDCINIERRHAKFRGHPTSGNDAGLLKDFMDLNFARVIPENAPDYRSISTQIRLIALRCKNTRTYTCEFGNEFAEKVEEYLRSVFGRDRL